MNTERKVKTVRCNKKHHVLVRGQYYLVEPGNSSHLEGNKYAVKIRFGAAWFDVEAKWRPHPKEPVDFIIEEFYPEESPSPYATIADVERMIREAMGSSEKVSEDEENQKDIFSRIASDVRSLEYKWRLYDKGAIKRTPPDIDSLIKDWIEQYTITRK